MENLVPQGQEIAQLIQSLHFPVAQLGHTHFHHTRSDINYSGRSDRCFSTLFRFHQETTSEYPQNEKKADRESALIFLL